MVPVSDKKYYSSLYSSNPDISFLNSTSNFFDLILQASDLIAEREKKETDNKFLPILEINIDQKEILSYVKEDIVLEKKEIISSIPTKKPIPPPPGPTKIDISEAFL